MWQTLRPALASSRSLAGTHGRLPGGERRDRCIREKALWERKLQTGRRRDSTGRKQPVNLKSLLSKQLTVGVYGLLSFRSSNQNLIYQRDPFSLLMLLFHGYILVHLVKVVVFQWLSLLLGKSLACISSCTPGFPDHWWRPGQRVLNEPNPSPSRGTLSASSPASTHIQVRSTIEVICLDLLLIKLGPCDEFSCHICKAMLVCP